MTQPPASETVGLFFSDVEGSTALALRLGDAYDELLSRHRILMRAAFVAHGGTEHGTEGDSFFVTFPTAKAAVLAAIDAQRALCAEPWKPGDEVRVRIGVHVGVVRRLGPNDFTGVDIHLAARVMSTGHGGQITVTRSVVEQLLGSDVQVRSLGEHQLKDIPRATELFQVEAEGVPSDFPPPKGVDRTEAIRLPRPGTAFFGRSEELKTGLALIASKRAVTVVGPPGAGKTRLALELAWQVQAGFALAVFVDLAAVDSPERVAQVAATACGVGGGADPVRGITGSALDRPTLLVLDNCEHVATAAADLVGALIDAAPTIKVLATSQVPLAVAGEAVIAVGSLREDDQGSSGAVELFEDRAAALGCAVPPDEHANVRAIVERLDGIPLAIELAASLTPTLSPGEILRRLGDRFKLLSGVDAVPGRRHSTLFQALASSFERLAEDERSMVRGLAVCVGTFSFEAIEGLVSEASAATLPTVHRLVRASWLTRESGPSGSRYRMLESLREYARLDAGEQAWAESRRTHARYFLGRQVELGFENAPRDYAAFAEVDEEIANIVAACEWAADTGEELDAASATVVRLIRYFQARPGWDSPLALVRRLADAAEASAITPERHSGLLSELVFLRSMVEGSGEQATATRARHLAEKSGDSRALLRIAHLEGQAAVARGDYGEAMRRANEVIDLATATGLDEFRQLGFYRRAVARWSVEGFAAAEEDLLASLSIANQMGDARGVTYAAAALTGVAIGRGDLAGAIALSREAETAAEQCQHGMWLIFSKIIAAELTLGPADLPPFVEERLVEAKRLGSLPVEGDVWLYLVRAWLRAGDTQAAVKAMEAFDRIGVTAGAHAREDVALVRARVLRAAGRDEEAAALLRNELADLRGPYAEGAAWQVVGALARWGLATSDDELNREIIRSALNAYRRFGDPREAAEAAAWDAENPDLAKGTDTPMPIDEAIDAILRDRT